MVENGTDRIILIDFGATHQSAHPFYIDLSHLYMRLAALVRTVAAKFELAWYDLPSGTHF